MIILSNYGEMAYAKSVLHGEGAVTEEISILMQDKLRDLEGCYEEYEEEYGSFSFLLNAPKLVSLFRENSSVQTSYSLLLEAQLESDTDPIVIGKDVIVEANETIVFGSHSEADQVGAVAIGFDTKADGLAAVAQGHHAEALGNATIAIGQYSQTLQDEAIAIGGNTVAQGESSISIGHGAQSNEHYAVAFGSKAIADGNVSVAIGADSHAVGGSSLSIGSQSYSGSYGATAIGTEAKAKEIFSTAIGFQALAEKSGSMALGINAQALEEESIAIGNESIVENRNEVSFGNEKLKRKLVNIEKGRVEKDSTDAVNGSQLFETDEKVAQIDQRVTNHESTINNLGDRVIQHDNHITSLEKQVTQNSGDILQIGDQITTITHQTGKRLAGIEEAFGAGAEFNEAGELKQPNYSVALALPEGQEIKDGVEAGFQYVGKTLNDHDRRINENVTNIKNITQGTAGIVKLDNNKIVIDNQLAKGAMIFDFSDQDQGGKSVARKLTGVAIGEVSETSSDAINGSQLHVTNQQITELDQSIKNHESTINNLGDRVTNHESTINNLGDRVIQHDNHITNLEKQVTQNSGDILQIGDQITTITHQTGKRLAGIEEAFGAGAEFNEAGELKQPNYSAALALPEGQEIKDGVEAGFQYVGKTLNDHDRRINENATNIKNITQGTAGIVKLDNNKIVIDNLLAKGAMIFDFSNSGQNRVLTGIARGKISQNSTDAVNGSQLFEMDQKIEKITNLNHQSLEGVADAFGGSAYVKEGMLEGVDFTNSLKADKPITNVNDGFGYVADRLDDHDKRLDKHDTTLENHENRITHLEDNITNIAEGKSGLVQLSEDQKTLVVDNDLGKNADTFDISNSNDERTLTGVKHGLVAENSKDAINGGQLYASNQSIAEMFGGGATIDKEGYILTPEYRLGDDHIFNNVGDSLSYLNSKIQEHGIFSLDREKNQIIIAENGEINQETVVNMGSHKVVGVANGRIEKGSQEAINGGQLWETQQQVVSNSHQIKHINNTLNHYNNRISNLERTVQQNRKVASAGISSAIAMSSIPYSQSNKHSFGMGVGSYDGEAAVSMGVIFNISPDARFKIQGSYDTQNKAGVGVGFSIDF
ncbi:YadA-like family protein [Ignatzschineria indica]|nr:YadA-like family protein [Ignatzschineria indica]